LCLALYTDEKRDSNGVGVSAVKRIAVIGVLLGTTSLVTPALAAPPAPVPVSDWSGNYMGIEGGYGWGTQNQNLIFPYNAQGTKCVDHEGTNPPTDCSKDIPFNQEFQIFNSQPPNPAVALGNINLHGGLGGYFTGFQRQFGNWVVGFETDFDFADIQGSIVGSNSSFHSDYDASIRKTNSVQMDARVSALASARLKFGWVLTPDWLIYGTGGVAGARVHETATQSASVTFCGGGSLPACLPVIGSIGVLGSNHSQLITGTTANTFTGDDTLLGWAAGAGVDWKYRAAGGSFWVFGIEYLHYGFNHSMTLSSGHFNPSIGVNENIDVVKGRITYFWPLQ
jgi:outer membrane immunogenic protein